MFSTKPIGKDVLSRVDERYLSKCVSLFLFTTAVLLVQAVEACLLLLCDSGLVVRFPPSICAPVCSTPSWRT